ncbi:hypothetical protein [Paenibacillus mendelii]|uniref:DUF5082 domain-containing protein n=1 Tax=Paenibacillus mendelii TaxID=206163 RepID=A0ABV6JFR5_9BACL|nr:hypothetical protein [Paenibacillus mendelii]MCQ6557422.1 hypothetical protein [Paenibacillus mendelii]
MNKHRRRRQGIAIHQQNERIQELLDACIQIAEHMNESGLTQNQVDQMKQELRNQIDHISSGSAITSDFSSAIAQLDQSVEELRQKEASAYRSETGGNPEHFESQFFEDQLEQSQAYHQKIDYKSLDKIKSNLEQIRNLING